MEACQWERTPARLSLLPTLFISSSDALLFSASSQALLAPLIAKHLDSRSSVATVADSPSSSAVFVRNPGLRNSGQQLPLLSLLNPGVTTFCRSHSILLSNSGHTRPLFLSNAQGTSGNPIGVVLLFSDFLDRKRISTLRVNLGLHRKRASASKSVNFALTTLARPGLSFWWIWASKLDIPALAPGLPLSALLYHGIPALTSTSPSLFVDFDRNSVLRQSLRRFRRVSCPHTLSFEAGP